MVFDGDAQEMETRLYRFFDSNARLLYVGISFQPVLRLEQHKDKSWYKFISSITIETYANRAGALEAEKKAIASEGPIFNIIHNPKIESPRILKNTPACRRASPRIFSLTDEFVNRIQLSQKQTIYWDSDVSSFGVRVGPRRKTFIAQLRIWSENEWQQTKVKIGTFPEMNVYDAREFAKVIREDAQRLKDPRVWTQNKRAS